MNEYVSKLVSVEAQILIALSLKLDAGFDSLRHTCRSLFILSITVVVTTITAIHDSLHLS